MNKDSDNFFAEMLLKGLGKDFYGEGSTAAGLAGVAADARAMRPRPGIVPPRRTAPA